MVDVITEFIAENYRADLSIGSIAQAVGLNASYMQKLFVKRMGNTVYDYLTWLRVDTAVRLMRDTDMAFDDIAGEAGFNNRQTFFNAFKATTGYNPKLFKKYIATRTSALLEVH